MNTYYIISEENKVVGQFDAQADNVQARFESWLNETGGLKEYLLVQHVMHGKLQIATTMVVRT